MIRRTIEKEISNWIMGDHRALLVDGARQVGKTYTIRHCLKEQKCDYVEVNLIDNQDALKALTKSESVDDLVINLSASTGHKFIKNKTIVFIDEVQELKELVTRIKFWVDDASFRYILSGSLLGVELRALRSAPVGYIHELKMYPLTFEEFMIANGVTEEVLNHLRDCFENKKKVGEIVHNKVMKLFNRYLVVGGMPQSVQKLIDTGNIGEIDEIQGDIISFYKRDYTKYEDVDKRLLLNDIYDLIPAQLLKQNRRFNYADIKKGLRFEKVENSFMWLYKAGVVLPSFNVTEPKIALKLNEKSSLVKLYYSDVGLLTFSCGDSMRRGILYGEGVPNLGGVYENAVIQELSANGFDVYYYNSKKLGELDFVVEYNGRVLPIEVKSGKDYYVHSAISNVVNNNEFDIEEAFVFSGHDVSVNGKIVYYPIYMTTFMKKKLEMPILEKIII
ncbi:ATP-binding protein [Butyrivibrio sp.]|uniref:ATP-binding protein n=1 Tax=Butyrivibrio sp. TaxID=28121 RepID=UPI0025BE3B66|nr:AAA family ATPase [Butyrivibrio sp.]MBQ9303022.1 ATP-binding protein [Butyrivibrio sp.]